MSFPDIELLIDGCWRKRSGDRHVINPFDESVLATVPRATAEDLDDALAAAERGFQVWRRTAPGARSQIIQRACRLVRERIEDLSRMMTLEQGKPVAQSRLEILRGCDILEWDAEEGRRCYGRIIPSEYGSRNIVLREPIGVVAAFSPWNFPMSAPSRKIGGALASGCSIILKAAEETPGSAVLLAKAFQDAGLPPGVLNLVFGEPAEISTHLISSPIVRLVTFTGSVPVGKKLAQLAARHMKPAIMELGGHGPVVVCKDTDPVKAAALSVVSKSRNAGQVCVSPTRFFIEEDIYDRFTTEFVARAQKMSLGDGLDAKSDMGPLANPRRLQAMERFVSDAIAKGARLLTGGARVGNNGNFFPLTVLADVPDNADAMTQEPFGPLALLVPVKDVEEAISKANSLPFGLAAYAFTESAATASILADNIACGNLAINHLTASFAETPFGGVKDSGYGREGGTEGLECYMTSKLVAHKSTLMS
jgi:succinate-semialdehyde dehydrogenase/glutarate-semialdehyde dehydrogenase